MNLLQEISNLKEELEIKKRTLNNVILKIKEEFKTRYSYEATRSFFHACFLVFGEYYNWYNSNISNTMYLSPRNDWKTNKYLKYYNIMQYTYYDRFGYGQDARNIGFVCFKKDLYNAIKHNVEEIWKYNVMKNKYKESLITFNNSISSNSEACYVVFNEYCGYKNHTLIIVNYPSLKIKNILIYLTQNN